MKRQKVTKLILRRDTLGRVSGGLTNKSDFALLCFLTAEAAGCAVTRQPNCSPPSG